MPKNEAGIIFFILEAYALTDFLGAERLGPSKEAPFPDQQNGRHHEHSNEQGKDRRIRSELAPGQQLRLAGNRRTAEQTIVAVDAGQRILGEIPGRMKADEHPDAPSRHVEEPHS